MVFEFIGKTKVYLREAVQKCNIRGLTFAAIWASEQLMGMESTDSENDEIKFNATESIPSTEFDQILLANALLLNREYQRCSYLLRKNKSTHSRIKSKLGLFLAAYSYYLGGEKVKDQANSEASKIYSNDDSSSNRNKSSNKKKPTNENDFNLNDNNNNNTFLHDIYSELLPLYNNNEMDGFLLYIFAIVVRDIEANSGDTNNNIFSTINNDIDAGKRPEFSIDLHDGFTDIGLEKSKMEKVDTLNCRQIFIESVALNPWNW
jgi:hypothetical protein